MPMVWKRSVFFFATGQLTHEVVESGDVGVEQARGAGAVGGGVKVGQCREHDGALVEAERRRDVARDGPEYRTNRHQRWELARGHTDGAQQLRVVVVMVESAVVGEPQADARRVRSPTRRRRSAS